MEIEDNDFAIRKEKARALYDTQGSIRNPYFGEAVNFTAQGFHHLQFSSNRERNKREQLLKFRFLPLAFDVIRKAGTLQEYRKGLIPVGKKSARGEVAMKHVEYWGFDAILGAEKIKIRTVLRRVGDGNIIFWSVMPLTNLKKGAQRKLFTSGIEDN